MNRTLWRLGAFFLIGLAASRALALAPWSGAYLFEEGSGTTALDSSGNLRHGTLTGATGAPDYVAGLYAGSNSSLRFNYDATTSSYDSSQLHRVEMPVFAPFVQNAPGMTLMAWVRPDAISANLGFLGSQRSIVSVSDGLPTASARGVLQVSTVTGQVRVLGRRLDGGANAFYTTSGPSPLALTEGQTYFVVGVLDFVNADLRLYVNGVQHTGGIYSGLANLGTADPTNLSANTANFRTHIGVSLQGVSEQWNGAIDGVRIFNRAVTSSEILATFNAEKVPEPTGVAMAVAALLCLAAKRRRNG